jgi:hypothetical protein
MIDTHAKRCYLMGVNQAIKITVMQKQPVTLTEAIQEALSLELIKEFNGTKYKIANMNNKNLAAIGKDLDDLTIKAINTKRAAL